MALSTLFSTPRFNPLSGVSEEHPDYPGSVFRLSIAAYGCFEEHKDPRHLEEAVFRAHQAIEALSSRNSTDPQLALWLHSFAMMLRIYHTQTGDLAIIDLAISTSLRAVNMPTEPCKHLVYLKHLGDLYELKFTFSQSETALSSAIDIAQRCVDFRPTRSELVPAMLSSLSTRLWNRFLSNGEKDFDKLDKAILLLTDAVRAIGSKEDCLQRWLGYLEKMLLRRYGYSATPSDLDEAVNIAERLILKSSGGASKFPGLLHDLSILFSLRYRRDGIEKDLDSAIIQIELAIAFSRKLGGTQSRSLTHLGALLQLRHSLNGQGKVFDYAVQVLREAIETTEADQIVDRVVALSTLAGFLAKRFEMTGEVEHLEQAIEKSRTGVKLSVGGGATVLSGPRSVLAYSLEKRYDHFGAVDDLEEAFYNAEEWTNLEPSSLEAWSVLGNLQEQKYLRYKKINHLEKACESAEQSLLLTKSAKYDISALSISALNFSNKLSRLYLANRDIIKLKRAVRFMRETVQTVPQSRPDYPIFLNSLSQLLQVLSRALVLEAEGEESTSQREAILKEAVFSARNAIDLTKETHPHRALFWTNLADLYRLYPEISYRALEIEALLKAWQCNNGLPLHRIQATGRLLRLLVRQNDGNTAVGIAKDAVKLLSTVHPRFLNYEDHQYVISYFSGLAADACSLVLANNDRSYEALDILEQGRGVILGILMDSRSDISSLREKHPEVAERYESLRAELSVPFPETPDLRACQPELLRRRKAAKDLEQVTEVIKSLDGYARFLQGLSEPEMAEQASKGPIVIINMTSFRSNALIVSHNLAIQAISLEEMSETGAMKWLRKDLTRFKREEYRAKNKLYRQFLLWLWSKCVKMVIEHIEKVIYPKRKTKYRIWWIGTGLASSLPFHAAGDHSLGSTDNTYSHAISSYTPSIKALGYTRASRSKPFPAHPRMLLTAMPKTPGERPLPGVSEEVKALKTVLDRSCSINLEEEPDSITVQRGMRECEIAHFACHGASNLQYPSRSHLILKKRKKEADASSNAEPESDYLTLQTVFDMSLKTSWIAYLSACSTAENKSQHLADEVLHLASGFQMSGFRHVIASMWPAADDVCVEVAKAFYQHIKQHWRTGLPDDLVAQALHDSVAVVRQRLPMQPLAWAPFVHYGA